MSYWDSDAAFLQEVADDLDSRSHDNYDPRSRQLRDIARDMERVCPEAGFLEELAGKIEQWSEDRTTPTAEYAEELARQLREISLSVLGKLKVDR